MKVAGFFARVGGIELGFEQAGNSVVVPVIKSMADAILKAIEKTDKKDIK